MQKILNSLFLHHNLARTQLKKTLRLSKTVTDNCFILALFVNMLIQS